MPATRPRPQHVLPCQSASSRALSAWASMRLGILAAAHCNRSFLQYGPIASEVLAACPRNSFYGGAACMHSLHGSSSAPEHPGSAAVGSPACQSLLVLTMACTFSCRNVIPPLLASTASWAGASPTQSLDPPAEDFWMGVNILEVTQVEGPGDCCSKCDANKACTRWTFCPTDEADGCAKGMRSSPWGLG